jgi:hypothetical protein
MSYTITDLDHPTVGDLLAILATLPSDLPVCLEEACACYAPAHVPLRTIHVIDNTQVVLSVASDGLPLLFPSLAGRSHNRGRDA